MKRFVFFVFALCLVCSWSAYADISITVYNNNRALVKESRDITLKKGIQTLEFDNVASQIDPTSVLPKFKNESNKIKVLEQNFDYDLVSTQKLLSKYIGKNIEIERVGEDKRSKISGTLLSTKGGIVVQTDKKIFLEPRGEISLEKLPEGLRLKPTLVWLIDSDFSGKNKMEIAYQTSGIRWNADYVLVANEDDTKADITGWVTVDNKSGATYTDANLKLIAGDVNMIESRNRRVREDYEGIRMMKAVDAVNSSFEEKSFFEYHIYKLQRKSTVKDNEIKQIEFVSSSEIPVKKVFTYNEAKNPTKVTVNLEFENSKANNLGIPLPKGKVRVSKYDGDSMEFVGEDMIDHTAKDAKISLYIGNAFDITGERKRLNYRSERKSAEESYQITIKNSKQEEVEVNVVENLYRSVNWRIENNSHEYKKTDSNTAEFLLKVPASGEKTLTYTIKYWWY